MATIKIKDDFCESKPLTNLTEFNFHFQHDVNKQIIDKLTFLSSNL